jgi:hypothetical protein
MKKLLIGAAAVLTVPFIALGAQVSVAHADPDAACNGTTGAARLACLQNVRQQWQQNQNACGDATGCSTGGIPGQIYQACRQAGTC